MNNQYSDLGGALLAERNRHCKMTAYYCEENVPEVLRPNKGASCYKVRLGKIRDMADTRKIVKVFLASPGDLGDERLAAKAVVDEFNLLTADDLGYQVELIGWEETVATFGRPQATINLELARCELFIGVMWKKWGTAPDIGGLYCGSGCTESGKQSCSSRHTSIEGRGRIPARAYFSNRETRREQRR